MRTIRVNEPIFSSFILNALGNFETLLELGLVDRFFIKPVQFSNRFIGNGSIFEPVYWNWFE